MKYKNKDNNVETLSYWDLYKSEWSINTFNFFDLNKLTFDNFRTSLEKNFKNDGSILIFGCGIAYNAGLEDKQTLHFKLSKKLDKKVYNFAICASGIQHMYAILKKFHDKIEERVDCAIYIYQTAHSQRLLQNIATTPIMETGINLKYKLNENTLKLEYPQLYRFAKSFIVKDFYSRQDEKIKNHENINEEKSIELAYQLFKQSREILKQKNPNIKFIIINYEIEENNPDCFDTKKLWKKLEQDGFIIVSTSEMVGRKFTLNEEDTTKDRCHPSEKVIDSLIPQIIKKI